MRASVRLLKEETQEHELKLEFLRKTVRVGLEEIDRGEGLSGESVFTKILDGLISES